MSGFIHDRRSGKFKCNSALNKLQFKRRKGRFWPTTDDKTHSGDLVGSKMTNLLLEY